MEVRRRISAKDIILGKSSGTPQQRYASSYAASNPPSIYYSEKRTATPIIRRTQGDESEGLLREISGLKEEIKRLQKRDRSENEQQMIELEKMREDVEYYKKAALQVRVEKFNKTQIDYTIDQLKRDNQYLHSENESLQEHLESVRVQLKDLLELKVSGEQNTDVLSNLQKQLGEKASEVSSLSLELQSLKSEVSIKDAAILTLNSDLASRDSTISSLRAELASVSKNLESLKVANKDLEEDICQKDNQTERSNAVTPANMMYSSLAIGVGDPSSSVALRRKYESIKRENDLMRKEMRAMKNLNRSRLDNSINSGAADDEIARLTKEISRLAGFKRELVDEREKNGELEARVSELEAENSQLKKTLQNTNTSQIGDNGISDAHEVLAIYLERISELEEENIQLKESGPTSDRLLVLQQQKDELEVRLSILKQTEKEKNQIIEDKNAELKALDGLKKTNEKLWDELNQLQEHLKKMESLNGSSISGFIDGGGNQKGRFDAMLNELN